MLLIILLVVLGIVALAVRPHVSDSAARTALTAVGWVLLALALLFVVLEVIEESDSEVESSTLFLPAWYLRARLKL